MKLTPLQKIFMVCKLIVYTSITITDRFVGKGYYNATIKRVQLIFGQFFLVLNNHFQTEFMTVGQRLFPSHKIHGKWGKTDI